jgi:tRNA (guanosine-2'-O-)-methyltransferase
VTIARVARPAWATVLALGCVALGCAAPARTAARAQGNVAERATVVSGPEVCGNAVDDNGNGLAEEGCGLTGGAVEFLIAWDEPTADVDLRIIDPNDELVEVGRPTESGLVKERDCPGRDGECRGKNLENVYLEQGEPAAGKYVARVVLVSLGNAEPPVDVRFWARVGSRAYARTLSLPRVESDWQTTLGL